MKTLFAVAAVVFAVALAVVVGNRLPVDAVAVIVGVVCGVLASIPTSLLILAVGNRRDGRVDSLAAGDRRDSRGDVMARSGQYPPVVVVNAPPGTGNGAPMWSPMPAWPAMPPTGPRQFKIIGQDSDNRYAE